MTQHITRHSFVSLHLSSSEDQDGNLLEQQRCADELCAWRRSRDVDSGRTALEGRGVGDTVEVTLRPEQGFGPHDPDLTFTDDIDNVPPEYRHLGAEVEFQGENGETRKFIVSRIEDGKLTVDCNHPFAGKTLVFTVNVIAVRDATPDEIVKGAPPPGKH